MLHPRITEVIRQNLTVLNKAVKFALTITHKRLVELRSASLSSRPADPRESSSSRTSREARIENYRAVTEALDLCDIDWWLVNWDSWEPVRIAISRDDKERSLDALAKYTKHNLILRAPDDSHFTLSAQSAKLAPRISKRDIWQVGVGNSRFGLEHGCTIESWNIPSATSIDEYVRAPQENRASSVLHYDVFSQRESVHFEGRSVQTLEVLTRANISDPIGPIDVVYTWVDGEDPDWNARREAALGISKPTNFHAEAIHEARYRNRDELLYSLRSIEMYAPWVRKVFIVTDQQIPSWLNTDCLDIKVVDHKDIIPEKYLPTFNSNVIISYLHHINDLSERYIYFNDDVLLTDFVSPHHFFEPNGIIKLFGSKNSRPFGPASPSSEPHFNITKNIRAEIEQRYGLTVSRAIKHTPHAQVKSLHREIETEFSARYNKTRLNKFRHHSDIAADQLFHYVSQIKGLAVQASFPYTYINIQDISHTSRLADFNTKLSKRLSICLNDVPSDSTKGIPQDTLLKTLNKYYPVKSRFEA